MRVENMAKNQFLITTDNLITFQSYSSKVCTWDTNNKKLILNGNLWDYSHTTRKYFKKFLNEYTNIEYSKKESFLNLLKTENNNIIIENN